MSVSGRTTGSKKYVVLVGDGMGDYPLPALGGKTPLEASRTPNMDRIASCKIGRVQTIPKGMDPGSDVANLSLMGYDPATCHQGRAPFEAASMGVSLHDNEVAFRMNLVSLAFGPDQTITMKSHNAGEITAPEARTLVDVLKGHLASPHTQIYPGVAYRHLLVWKEGPIGAATIPPHDVLDQDMTAYLEKTEDPVVAMIQQSWPCLKDHPVNRERRTRGLMEANSVWLWGQGRRPTLPSFEERFGLKGGVISAVDLLKGIGVYAGLRQIPVAGITGYLDTNFRGKAKEALKALSELDFMFVHVEAPDEASHKGSVDEKIQAIEAFDEKVVGPVLAGLEDFDDFRILVVSDHLTPIPLRTHVSDPTLFAWASGEEWKQGRNQARFTEIHAAGSGLFFEKGHDLLPAFLAS